MSIRWTENLVEILLNGCQTWKLFRYKQMTKYVYFVFPTNDFLENCQYFLGAQCIKFISFQIFSCLFEINQVDRVKIKIVSSDKKNLKYTWLHSNIGPFNYSLNSVWDFDQVFQICQYPSCSYLYLRIISHPRRK